MVKTQRAAGRIRVLGVVAGMAACALALAQDPNRPLVNVPIVPYTAQLKLDRPLLVMFNGSRLSKILPCGCHARDLGGVDKEAAMLNVHRALSTATLALDAGGWFREFTDEDLRLQTYYLLQSLRLMKYDAINIGYSEFKHGIDSLKRIQQQMQLPFISANIFDLDTSSTVFEPYKIFDMTDANGRKIKVGVIGVTAPNARASNPPDQPPPPKIVADASGPVGAHLLGGAAAPAAAAGGSDPALEFALEETSGPVISHTRYEVLDEVAAAAPLAAKLRGECQVLVLLCFDGPFRTKRIAQTLGVFDLVIAGDSYNQWPPERLGEGGRTLWITSEHEGRYLGRAEFTFDEEGRIEDKEGELLPVDQNIVVVPELTAMIDRYKKDKAKLPPPRSRTAEKIYSGMRTCGGCHKKEFDQWKTTRHSTAMKSLLAKKMEFNPDCLRCHVVAYKQPGGFTDMLVTGNLSNVQCESCHGPGHKHSLEEQGIAKQPEAQRKDAKRSATLRTSFDAQFCADCHDQKNDPDFNFERDIKIVDHSTSGTANTAGTTGTKVH